MAAELGTLLTRAEPLSQAQREVLAIVAYAQPPSRARVDEIRGTSGDARVGFLLRCCQVSALKYNL